MCYINTMTMHLERGLTTLNTKKRKTKPKKTEYYMQGFKEQNKFLKSKGLPQMTEQDYIDYRRGKYKPPVTTTRSVVSTVSTSVSKTVSEGSNPSTPAKQEPKLSNKIGGGATRNWREEKERLEVSRQYSIAPAYNKGPYMVVNKSDLKTAGRKV